MKAETYRLLKSGRLYTLKAGNRQNGVRDADAVLFHARSTHFATSRLLPLLCLTLLLMHGLAAQSIRPAVEYLTVQNGLPQGFIKSLLQDQRGFIWLATRDGLCRYDGVRFKIYHHDPPNNRSLSFSSIYELKETREGLLWLRTENNTVDLFDPVTEQTNRVSETGAFSQAVGRDLLTSISPDQHGNVWVATLTNGFFRLSPDGTINHRHWPANGTAKQHTIRSVLVDQQNRLWVATTDGLYHYDPVSGRLAAYGLIQGLPQTDVWTLHERLNGELMLGFPGRFAFFNPVSGQVRRVLPLPDQPHLPPFFTRDYRGNDYVGHHQYSDKTGLLAIQADPKFGRFTPLSLLVDRSNVLWVGTNGDGIVKYDLNKRPFQDIKLVSPFQTDWITRQLAIPADAIPTEIRQSLAFYLRYQFDGQQRLWISGPMIQAYRYDPTQRRFNVVRPVGIPSQWLVRNSVRFTAVTTGPQGEFWGLIGPANRAVARYNPDQQSFTVFPLPLPPGHPYDVVGMTVDGGRIYLATQNHGLLRADLSPKRLIHWRANPNDPNSLPVNSLLSLIQDPIRYNYLWIGTYGNGLCRFDKLTGQIKSFTTRHGLPNQVIYGIRPDRSGHLWLSTNRGLCRFDTRLFEVRNYSTDDGLPSEEFNRFHDIGLPDGQIIFGGIGGYTVFDPQRVRDDVFKPVVALTDLRINNQPVSAADPESPIVQDINETRELTLTHQQNFLSFDFAALQFNQHNKNRYRYKLIGLDNDWVYSGTQATATYTNLSPATYTFVVNASNTSGVWSPHTRQIRIVIEPSPWATWWAYTGYALLLTGAMVAFVRVRINRIRLQSRMELREKESVQLKNLDEIKSRFFANITHEFRTPLTLILTPLEQLLQEIADPQHQGRLTMVHRNASQLLRLINELLDLAKLEAGSLTVTATQGDLVEFVERTVSLFDDEARHRNIRLRVHHQVVHRFFWFDADKVEKIVNNLLTNALKFTNENGTVDVTLSARLLPDTNTLEESSPAADSLIRLTVADTGTGIPDHKLPHIFNRFYQADQPGNRTIVGSGIGLALVKELVDVLHGRVKVESRPGLGSTFTIELPCRMARAQGFPAKPALQPLPPPRPLHDPASATNGQAATDPLHILLVEDNDDIAEFVTEILSTDWQVRRVSNGRAGLEAAIADGPDMVISDVLMPEMDGYELCRQLKSNTLTNHIPIMLLTAKAAVESRVEGFTAGADDYLTKPFQVDELRWRVRNRLEQQRRSRQHLRTQLLSAGHLPTTSPVPEDEFMNKAYAVIKARLDDSTFGVEPLADAVGLSRMQLNRKVKALTSLSPVELIRAVRLNRAAEMLLTNVPISEVAYAVGFDTPAYFSKVFKDEHGLTPSEYVEQNRPKSA